MPGKKIKIIQQGNRFTMELIEGDKISVLVSDHDGTALNYSWWLNPTIYNLAQNLKEYGCSDLQIREAYEDLLSGHDTHLELDIL
jgi:hypothetical protein